MALFRIKYQQLKSIFIAGSEFLKAYRTHLHFLSICVRPSLCWRTSLIKPNISSIDIHQVQQQNIVRYQGDDFTFLTGGGIRYLYYVCFYASQVVGI